jgi:hypothetical protein
MLDNDIFAFALNTHLYKTNIKQAQIKSLQLFEKDYDTIFASIGLNAFTQAIPLIRSNFNVDCYKLITDTIKQLPDNPSPSIIESTADTIVDNAFQSKAAFQNRNIMLRKAQLFNLTINRKIAITTLDKIVTMNIIKKVIVDTISSILKTQKPKKTLTIPNP